MRNLITIQNFNTGIEVWTQKKWDSDFHNSTYRILSNLKQNGLGEHWWIEMVNILWSWRAIRPLPKSEIILRGKAYLAELQGEYNSLLARTEEKKPSIENTDWKALQNIFRVASKIKNVKSPVFASKFCHFLLPNVFPVIDQEVIGINNMTYENYWHFCQTQWLQSNEKTKLTEILKGRIGDTVVDDYPYCTKVTEICIIGSKTNNSSIR